MLALLAASALLAPAPPARVLPGFQSISAEKAAAHVARLAGPEFYGRGTGQRGYQLAAEWMAGKFKSFGLQPIGEHGYFHQVPFTRFKVLQGSLQIGSSQPITMAQGLTFDGLSSDLALEGLLTVIPGPNSIPAEGLEGRVLLVLGSWTDGQQGALLRARPAAVIWASDSAWGEPEVRFGHNQAKRAGRGAAWAFIPHAQGLAIAARAGASAEARATSLAVRLSAAVEAENTEVPNVVGWLPGSDPSLRHEFVGIGCHLDHLGIQRGIVYPGADDDGSGSAAVLLAAEAFARNPARPKRSILFMGFTGEEMGLLGAGHLAANPPGGLKISDMLAEFQLDMVGRNEEQEGDRPEDNVDTIHLVGSKKGSMDWHNLVVEQNRHVGFTFEYDQEDVYRRSDHYKFAEKGVPVAFLFAGFHPDYHRPTDTPEKINHEKIAMSARLAYLSAFAAAERGTRFPMNGEEGSGSGARS
jgi:hypothetical protein